MGYGLVQSWGRNAVYAHWLNTIGLGQYAQHFAEDYIDAGPAHQNLCHFSMG
jgi:hypothetical protein